MVKELLEDAVLATESSQPQSSYEAAATLIEFKLKNILIDKMDKSESYLAAPKHTKCYEGLIKSYDLDKTIFFTYGKVYSLKKRKTSKDAKPAKGPKAKESQSGSSKGDKSQSKSSRKSVQLKELEFEVGDSNMPQDQEENPGNDDEEPKEKPSKTFDELMSTPIDFFAFIMNGLNINNHTQETMLGPAFRLLKGTCSNYAELEYDFKECYKALSEKLDWENPKGCIKDMVLNIWVPVKVSYDKHALWGISHWREQRKTFYGYGYLREIVVRRADNDLYRFNEGDFPRLRINDIEDMLLLVQNRLINLSGDDISDFTIALRMKKDPYTPYQDPQGFIYVDENGRNMLMRSDELYKFNDGTLTRLRTSLDDITKNIRIKYLPKRIWSTLEKKKANIMLKAIDKQLKEIRMMRSLKKFVGGRDYRTDLRLLQRII
nr:hypothetical protein [Tanacetum cinerariifolium]